MRDIVDDEPRRDCPQSLCARRVPAAQEHLLRWRSSPMSRIAFVARMQLEELHRLSICPRGARNAACCTFTTGC